MKVIIAGGRDFVAATRDAEVLHYLHRIYKFTEIVSGGAAGADKFGEAYGQGYGIPVKVFPADWNKHGKAAGPIRNVQMAEYADACICFPGGKGTEHMALQALRFHLLFFDFRGNGQKKEAKPGLFEELPIYPTPAYYTAPTAGTLGGITRTNIKP